MPTNLLAPRTWRRSSTPLFHNPFFNYAVATDPERTDKGCEIFKLDV